MVGPALILQCLETAKDLKIRGQEKGVFRRGFLAEMYASVGCGVLSATCTAGPISLSIFVSLGVTLDSAETPLAKTPFA